ncbi:hypothetical protein F0P96_00350 [Hymenobacter busanensis]|uniref:Uncharacterized protein n=1 Tax=Hymenobacter busanensis TaxID=2607656 RepID=A0A7L4ZUH7_9BACT|nr:hypothetical protein [Hymenobacter busanensis]KAA9339119.1 hypothetical protein F0P96_00350 [Hymenobacter busanensis]QHJ07119.1 hypothetical protein GUY19_07400 [Hymenobacter busanensis]
MQRLLACFLSVLILLQTFSREVMVLDYQVHKERVTQLFCINKARPQMHCNGKCHLRKQLRKATEGTGKTPAAGFAKIKYDVVPVARPAVPAGLVLRPTPLLFAGFEPADCPSRPTPGVFHPPLVRA